MTDTGPTPTRTPLRQAEVHGSISLTASGEYLVACGYCEWAELHTLDYAVTIGALVEHLIGAHRSESRSAFVVAFR